MSSQTQRCFAFLSSIWKPTAAGGEQHTPHPFSFQNQPKSTSKSEPLFFGLKFSVYFPKWKIWTQRGTQSFFTHKACLYPRHIRHIRRQLGWVRPATRWLSRLEAPQVAPISVEQRPELEDVAIDAGGSRLWSLLTCFATWFFSGGKCSPSFFGGEDEAL